MARGDKRGERAAPRAGNGGNGKGKRPSLPPRTPLPLRGLAGLGLLAALASAGVFGLLPPLLAIVLGGLNVATLATYALDKRAAVVGNWRTPERTLHLLALAGGWPAALVAQQLLRHKTSKPGFQRLFWLSVAGNLALLATLAWITGALPLR